MKYPQIYLALDNCFAIKRWVEPESWMPLIKDLGFNYIEASFDNELDFLYSPKWYVNNWFDKVNKLEKKLDMRVVTAFTGYQTYRTSGLSHPDEKFANHLLENWLRPAIEKLGEHGAGIGFSFHAITDEALQDPALYHKVTNNVTRCMAKVARLAATNGGIPVCVEAMYAPHQPPWTIKGTFKFLQDIYAINHDPIYTTVDVGHMIGQVRYQKPTENQVLESLQKAHFNTDHPGFWMGAEHTVGMWREAVCSGKKTLDSALQICNDIERFDYMFSDGMEDSDPYAWLEQLGCYSPIIHMQQTNGKTASHAAFTENNNKEGIIKGERFLRSLAKSYESAYDPKMPPKADKIYLAFEIFASNIEYRHDTIQGLKDTSKYWRQFIPSDGITLDKLVDKLSEVKENLK